jgi:hypothetical protein
MVRATGAAATKASSQHDLRRSRDASSSWGWLTAMALAAAAAAAVFAPTHLTPWLHGLLSYR